MNELLVDTHAYQQRNKISAPSATAYTPSASVMTASTSALVVLRQPAHPMAASVGPGGGQYIGQQVLIDRSSAAASAESRCCCLVVPIKVVAQPERWMEY
jgi:hypothetical protein